VRRILPICSLLAITGLLALPGTSGAAAVTFGSLGTSASTAETDPVDTAFWLTAQPAGATTVPVRGLVKTVQLRGCAQAGPKGQKPLREIHFQTLVPRPNGSVRVKVTSQGFKAPVCQGAGPATQVSAYHPFYMCAKAGDYIGFSDSGGFAPGFPGGVSYEFFAPTTGFNTDSFTGAGRDNNGDAFTGTAQMGVQLLMQVTIVTGKRAGPCK